MKKIVFNLMLISIVGLGGCTQITKRDDPTITGPFHSALNVYVAPGGLPANVRRVAVLPLIHGRGNRGAERGVPLIRQVFTQELSRARLFEVVTVTPDELYTMSGVRAVYADQKLPVDLIDNLKESTGCQAVLFAELTTYRAYAPVAVGWKLHLFDLETEELLWAVDEVYDTGQAPVANALRRHMRDQLAPNLVAVPRSIVLDSPRDLSRFSLSNLFEVLFEKNSKVGLRSVEDMDSQRGFELHGTEPAQPVPVEPQNPEDQDPPDTTVDPTAPPPRPGAI